MLPMEKAVSEIIKIGQQKHMESFYRNGEMCFNPVEYFNKRDSNKERFDITEGVNEIKQVEWLKIVTDDEKTYEFSNTGNNAIKLNSSILLSSFEERKGNIFSCIGINPENRNYFRKLKRGFLEFGDTAVLITNPKTFSDRVSAALLKNRYNFKFGYVNYLPLDTMNGKWSVFLKPTHFQHQSEIRIWVKTELKEKLVIKIGSIKDISKIFSIRSSKTKY